MKFLYAPWRTGYSNDKGRSKQEDTTADECIFCMQLKEDNDQEHYIFKRFEHMVVMLNLYPYNAGHLLIIPQSHTKDLAQLLPEARQELIELMSACQQIVHEKLGAQGSNIGINFGKAGGAGIPAHLHVHVLPRWPDDTNFLPTLADTKAVSFDLNDVYRKLKPAIEAIKID